MSKAYEIYQETLNSTGTWNDHISFKHLNDGNQKAFEAIDEYYEKKIVESKESELPDICSSSDSDSDDDDVCDPKKESELSDICSSFDPDSDDRLKPSRREKKVHSCDCKRCRNVRAIVGWNSSKWKEIKHVMHC
jgi:hypothetical protein